MNKIFFLFLFSAASIAIFPQTKYFIYFKDKGVSGISALSKGNPLFEKISAALSGKCIERRQKTLGKNNYITEDDIPVSEAYVKQIENLGIKIENKLKWFNAISAYLSEEQLYKIKQLPFVSKTEKVKILKSIDMPVMQSSAGKSIAKTNSDTVYGGAYDQLELSGIPEVHGKGITGSGIVIGLLDSGFNWEVPTSLANSKILGEYDFVFHDSVTADEKQDYRGQDSHGTAVLSTIAANKPGAMMGAAYNASFYLAKTEYIPTETKTEEDNFAAGMEWLESKGIDIASTSLGYNIFDNDADSYTYSDMNGRTAISTKAFQKAFSYGIVLVCSAGNEGDGSWKYITTPADADSVISVGAVDKYNKIASFSSRGPTSDNRTKPEVVAQGVNDYVVTTGTANSYSRMDGTSFAAPITCGVAALLLSAYPQLTNKQVRSILLNTADNASAPNNNIGWGLVSAKRAVSFPNISKGNNEFLLNKIFFPNKNISSVSVFTSEDGTTFTENSMDLVAGLYYRYTLPVKTDGLQNYFYFVCNDSLGNSSIEPQTGLYAFNYGSTDIKITTPQSIADIPALSQNYPNPARSFTFINFKLEKDCQVSLKIYDILGKEVKTLLNGFLHKGAHSNKFDMQSLASGIYFYRLNAGGKLSVKKLVLIK